MTHLGAHHGSAFGNTAQRLAKVTAATDKWGLELVLVDMMGLISHGEHLTLVDIVDLEALQDLRLDEMTNAALSHHLHASK